MFKRMRQKLDNRGSSFVMVVVALAFITILSASIITAIGYAYRLKATDLQSRNNFYYVDKAVDEIYAGMGNMSVEHLKKAYEKTLGVVVYYDVAQGRYVTMEENAANALLKQQFMLDMIHKEVGVGLAWGDMETAIAGYVTDPSIIVDTSKGYMKVEGVDATGTDTVWDQVLYVTDNALGSSATNTLSTKDIQSIKKITFCNVTVGRITDDGFQQSVTTDFCVAEPPFNVSFSGLGASTSNLFQYAVLADKGVEVSGASKVSIVGNLYAASDFYNKDYNNVTGNRIHTTPTDDTTSDFNTRIMTAVSSTASGDGKNESSKYSGLFVTDRSTVNVMGETVIVPGTITAWDNSSVTITKKVDNSATANKNSEIWCDNIVTGGDSATDTAKADIYAYANTYVADDLELNAKGSNVKLDGNYYGYNYGSNDNKQTIYEPEEKAEIAAGTLAKQKAHYNSSAIVVNGEEASLDLSNLDTLMVAGRSYIELTKKTDTTVDSETNKTSYTYRYSKKDDNDVALEDYQTGESIAVKSTQVAYLKDDKILVLTPEGEYNPNCVFYTKFVMDVCGGEDPLDETNRFYTRKISGNEYNYLNFKTASYRDKFITWYASDALAPYRSNYENGMVFVDGVFKPGDISVPEGADQKVYTSGAISLYNGTKLDIVAPKAVANEVSAALGEEAARYQILYRAALENNLKYKKMKYVLSPTMDATEINDSTDSASITPLNYYVKYDMVRAFDNYHKKLENGSDVWVSKGDVTISGASGIQGVVIAMGDVTFDESVKRFEGIIISGGKVKVSKSMELYANEEVVSQTLKECYDYPNTLTGMADTELERNTVRSIVYLFYDYVTTSGGDNDNEAKDIGTIDYQDVLTVDNWKKNVLPVS